MPVPYVVDARNQRSMFFYLFLFPQSPSVVQNFAPSSDEGDGSLFAFFGGFLHLHGTVLPLDAGTVMVVTEGKQRAERSVR